MAVGLTFSCRTTFIGTKIAVLLALHCLSHQGTLGIVKNSVDRAIRLMAAGAGVVGLAVFYVLHFVL